jgi:hypothetical protein
LDSRAAIMLIRLPTIIIRMGITGDLIITILSRIRTVTGPGTTDIELITAPIAIILTTNIKWHNGAVAVGADLDGKCHVAEVKTGGRSLKPRLHEVAKIRQKIAGGMDEYDCEEIFRPGPDDTESDSAYCQDNNRVSNRVERARI